MKKQPLDNFSKYFGLGIITALLLFGGFFQGETEAFVLNVIDDNGQVVSSGFRWLVEEDNTYGSTPWIPNQPGALPGMKNPNAPYVNGGANPSYSLGVNIHRSHAPVLCAGDTAVDAAHPDSYGPPTAPSSVTGGYDGAPSSITIDGTTCPGYNPAKQYIVSVLPWHTAGGSGYMMSGRNIAAHQNSINVIVHNFPMPTAQLTALVFEDNQPINGALDQPAEHGLANFQLLLSDPAGQVMQDAFAYPVGTTYKYKYSCTAPACIGPNVPADADGNPLPQGQQPEFQLDADGFPVVDFMGDGTLTSCPGGDPSTYNPYQKANCIDPYTLVPMTTGEAVVRYLAADKYTIEPIPTRAGTFCDPLAPSGFSTTDCSDMLLTATLEGTRGNDMWVRATEPRYNINLGQLNWLVFYGFVHPMNNLASVPLTGSPGSISGQVVYAHDAHPPQSAGLSPGLPVPDAYVGLNNLSGNDEQVYTAACDPNTGQFSIPGVPPGNYQLVMWDKLINAIIDFRTLTVASGQAVNLGPVSVYGWFAHVTGKVFNDVNGNGFPNSGDAGISNLLINLRYTDGSFYKSTVTDPDGSYSFPQYFTWWRFLIAETDNSRFKPTGLTSIVDNGGPLTNNGVYTGTGATYASMGINPQLQGSLPYRTQTGRVTTQAFNLYQDMTDRIDFGKAAYAAGENGGVRGGINYATTRTEEDPRNSAWDGWEPAVPNVNVFLHKVVQDINGNWVTDTSDARFPLTTKSSSWNDNLPTGCIGEGNSLWAQPEMVNGFAIPSCAETFYHWDQTRPGIFDGAYAFDTMPNGTPIPPGYYVVQVVPPAGYKVLDWADRNIEFGDPKIPFLLQPPTCVGALYDIPPYHTLFPDQQVPTDTTVGGLGDWIPGIQAPSCDMKLVTLNPGANGRADFNLFTWVPKAGRIWGTVWNDLFLEFNPTSPNASGNFAVPWLPVAIKDWKGTEVARFYTDQWGHFDGMVPANYDIAPPIPLGLVLNMLHIAANDPGPIDPSTGLACNPLITPPSTNCITDPWFNPNYSQEVIRENWEFYPGKTTFIDTIVLPIGGFLGNRVPLNCSYVNKTPEILQVSDVIIPPGGKTITITSIGNITVPNPNYDPALPVSVNNQPTLIWDHGFGTVKGTVTVGGTRVTTSWSSGSITAAIPNGLSGQLVVTRGDNGLSTTVGVTLRIAGASPVINVYPPASNCSGLACGVIQAAVNSAPNGAIILLHPGTNYQENVNLWKPISLQGFGAPVTILDGTATLGNFALKDAQFAQLQNLIATGAIDIVPGQASDFTLEQGAGILVAGCDPTAGCPQGNSFSATGAKALIDGLTITGSSEAGGGILVNGFTNNLRISNNEINYNQGSIGGGIRVGESTLPSNFNPNLTIDHNRIAQNGSLFSGGGGIALYSGSDNYQITKNMICGNFSALYGGGIGHFGLSNGGLIQNNFIVSNESFDEGGGVHIGGEPPAGATGLTVGAGSVVINANLIEGNKAGDDGGGLRTLKVNGLDVADNPADQTKWFQIDIFNNMVVNNSSADHGGGMSFDDTVKLTVISNTVARNDSTATSSDAFGGPCTENSPIGQVCPVAEAIGGLVTSIPQVAGIASFAHSTALLTALQAAGSAQTFSNPLLVDNIIWQNRSFYWDASANNNLGALLLSSTLPGGPAGGYWDLAVYGTATPQTMSPTYSLLTTGIGATPSVTNILGLDPQFLNPYFNIYQATSKGSALGNFVVATFTPNGIQGDYHINIKNAGSSILKPLQNKDYDGDSRRSSNLSTRIDIGADQKSIPHVWPQ